MTELPFAFTLSLPEWAVAGFAALPEFVATAKQRMRLVLELARRNVLEESGGPFAAAVFEHGNGRLVAVGVRRVRQRMGGRAGRGLLYAATFASFEDKVRDELGRMFGPAGFDAARDIAAITVNRWGHGYAYTANSLHDRETKPMPYEVAHRRVGRIAIANSDAGWSH